MMALIAIEAGGASAQMLRGFSRRAEVMIVANVVASAASVTTLSAAVTHGAPEGAEELGVAAQVEQDVMIDLTKETGAGDAGKGDGRGALKSSVLRLVQRAKELPGATMHLPALRTVEADGRGSAPVYRLVVTY